MLKVSFKSHLPKGYGFHLAVSQSQSQGLAGGHCSWSSLAFAGVCPALAPESSPGSWHRLVPAQAGWCRHFPREPVQSCRNRWWQRWQRDLLPRAHVALAEAPWFLLLSKRASERARPGLDWREGRGNLLCS